MSNGNTDVENLRLPLHSRADAAASGSAVS